ncbi:uncharacterized protein LOC127002756 [Eriocheir sinensis]|uniref:uncharacterized protein LOC127002756 n=1 Tax=Eriocheir sinensis TaxID=95602 RepID=UPI0021C60671|nr:uncharacterized protein LOC127002756 [Eriocheir sinensis]
MKCLILLVALSCVAAGQKHNVPLLTRLLRPTYFPTDSLLDPNAVKGLSPPPPPSQHPAQEFSPSPQLPPTAPEQRSLTFSPFASSSSKSRTSSPFISSPTTIKFTLDDASTYFQPQLAPRVSKKQDSLTRLLLESPAKEVAGDETDSALSASEDQYLWIVTSPEEDTLSTDEEWAIDNVEGRQASVKWIPEVIKPADQVFRPSLSFPFLTDAPRPTTKATLAEESLVAAASNLQSQPLHFAEPDFNLFALNPLKIEDSKSKVSLQELKNDRPLSKTPVPQVVDFSEEKENSVESTNEAPSARRTLHFDEEFLTLIKSHNPKESNETVPAASDGNLLWLREGLREKARLTDRPRTELPGAFLSTFKPSTSPKIDLPGAFFSTFKPSLAPKTELPEAFFSTLKPSKAPNTELPDAFSSFKTSQAPKTELPGAFFSTFKPSQAPKTDLPDAFSTSKSPQPPKTTKTNIGGVFTTSLRGLASTPASRAEVPAGKSSEGPKVTPVGEVGEVAHEDEGSEAALVTPLSAALKHGVQSLNVSAWVSGCPKLYGKVELNCAVQHDALAKAVLTMRWKKKTFKDGRMEEEVLSEDNLVTLKDPRISLARRGEHYNLAVKDFRAQDCGSYECEARAADTVSASQLLLFMCH